MEEQNAEDLISEDQFLELLKRAREKDSEAILLLLKYFEQDMLQLSRNIRMPQEDAIQSMKLGLIELISNRRENSWT